MNIEDALQMTDQEAAPRETLNVVGTIEADAEGRIRIYPDPFNLSHYVTVVREHIDGEVVDVTEHARRIHPARRGTVFSVPIVKGGEHQLTSVTTVTVTDVAKMRFLSLEQSGGCGCGSGSGHDEGCTTGRCITVEGVAYDCSEKWEGWTLCSGCCLIASA